jgi:hypothetical protein
MAGDTLIRCHDVKRMTTLSVRKIQQMAAAGEIPSRGREAGGWLFFREEVLSWIRAKQAAYYSPEKAARRCSKGAIEATASEAEIVSQALPWPQTSSGIYFLVSGGRVVYVGQARNVVLRIAAHSGVKKFDGWHWIKCPKSRLDETERAYINKFLPELNKDPVTKRLKSSREKAPSDG